MHVKTASTKTPIFLVLKLSSLYFLTIGLSLSHSPLIQWRLPWDHLTGENKKPLIYCRAGSYFLEKIHWKLWEKRQKILSSVVWGIDITLKNLRIPNTVKPVRNSPLKLYSPSLILQSLSSLTCMLLLFTSQSISQYPYILIIAASHFQVIMCFSMCTKLSLTVVQTDNFVFLEAGRLSMAYTRATSYVPRD